MDELTGHLDRMTGGLAHMEQSFTLAVAYAAAIFCALIGLATLLTRIPRVQQRLHPDQPGKRYGGIDGLRGLLAVGVFVHHSFAAGGYFQTGRWQWSESAVFNHLGQTTVALFFMITAFLFSSRLMAGPVNWRAMFASRVMRLTPLYVVFTAAVFVSAMHFSGWTLHEPVSRIARELSLWAAFGVLGRPDINALPMTWTLCAGVNWSLHYEWVFYFFMPVLLVLLTPLRKRMLARAAVLAFFALLLWLAIVGQQISGSWLYRLHFVCGVAVALMYRDPSAQRILRSRKAQAMGCAALGALLAYKNGNGAAQLLLSTVFFAAVTGSGRGLLHLRPVRWLGEISYGVYLLHGLVLFWVLSFIGSAISEISVPGYALLVIAVGSVAVAVASILHFVIELPGISLGARLGGRRPGLSSSLTADGARG